MRRYLPPPLAGRAGWGLTRPEDLRDLPCPVIAHQQAAIGSFGDRKRLREPGREIADLSVLARAIPGEHHAHDSPPRWTADIGAPFGDEGVLGVIRAELGAVVKDDTVRRRVRREDGDWRGDPGAVAVETAVRIRRPAARPSRVRAVRHSQEMVGRLRPEVVLAVDGDVGIAGRCAQRQTEGITAAAHDDTGITPVSV